MSTKEDEKKILMIDDSDAALEIMELYVESEFENPIITAANGNEAIEILKKTSNISVIICDYNMPKGDGGDVFQYVTQNCPSIPFILVCGEDAQTIKTLPKLEGLLNNKKVLPVIPKPFRKDGLVQAVKYITKHTSPQSNQLIKKIHLNRFFQYNDIFEKNKIKILGHDDFYQAENLYMQYKERNLQYIYFEKNQFELFLALVFKEINNELNSSHRDLDEDITLQLDAIQITHESVRHNINLEMFKGFPDKISSSILNIVKSGVPFKKILEHVQVHPHLPSQLGILNSYLSCHLLSKTDEKNFDVKFSQFIKASIFMDVSLEDEELVNINDLNEKAFLKLVPSYKKYIQEHPKKSIGFFKKICEHDPLIETLIENHHGPQFSNSFKEDVENGKFSTDVVFFSMSHHLSQEILKKNLQIEQIQEVAEHIKDSYPKETIIKNLKKIA
ncbi:response regulator [Bacteriovoracales bacterium]|nr:response regulator [Bacteriovoracales bacterium]